MFDASWISSTGTDLVMVAISGVAVYLVLLLLTRLAGLRSFSKMSSFDFALTVAFGSVIATAVLSKEPSVANAAVGLVVLYGIQYLVSKLRSISVAAQRVVDNRPLLLMAGDQVLDDHLRVARMTRADLRSELRAADVTHPRQVLAVVFETAGHVSVMTRRDEVDLHLFDGVRGAEEMVAVVGAAEGEMFSDG